MDYSMTIVWLLLFAAFLIVELLTMGLTTIWFAGGSLVACLSAALHAPIWLQIIIFLVVSVLLLYFTRPIAVKYFNKSRTRTNVESMIGLDAIVISEINNLEGIGQVKVNGMDWSARSKDGSVITVGSVVKIASVEGVKLIVESEPNKEG